MSDPRWPDGHPDEERLLEWLDEPQEVAGGAALAAHLTGCPACRDRTAELRGVLAALAAPTETPEPAAFAAQRERIHTAISRPSGVRPARRAWWVPALAAAAVVGLLVFGPWTGGEAPAPGDPAAAGTVPLPVAEAAQAAADEVFALAETAAEEETPDAGSAATAAAALPALDPALPPPGEPEPGEFAELALEFAGLGGAEQAAILEELETVSFDL